MVRVGTAAGANLRAEVVAGHIKLTPIASRKVVLARKAGLTVVRRTGVKVDVAAMVAVQREVIEERALRR